MRGGGGHDGGRRGEGGGDPRSRTLARRIVNRENAPAEAGKKSARSETLSYAATEREWNHFAGAVVPPVRSEREF